MSSPNHDQHNNPDLTPGELIAIILATGLFVVLLGGISSLVINKKIALLGEIFIIIPALGYVRYKGLAVRKIFRLTIPGPTVIFYSVAIAIISFVLIDEIDRLISLRFPMPEEQLEHLKELLAVGSFGEAVLVFLSAVLFASIAEEMFFRGFVQRNFEFYSDPATTMVFTSVFFALTHFSFEVAIQILLLGLILSYTSWKANSIVPAIVIHAVNNFLSLLLLNLPEKSTAWYATESHVRIHWLVVAFFLAAPVFVQYIRSCDRGVGRY